MDKGLRVRAYYRHTQNAIEIYAYDKERDEIADKVVYVPTPQSTTEYHEPLFLLRDTAAQELMDDLWACGVRPTEGKGSAGMAAAMQENLKDLREIIKVVLPKVVEK